MSKNLKDINNELNAIVSFVEEGVFAENGLLAGWDVALKDNINMKGTLTTASCKLLSNYESIYDATVTRLIKESGANIVAKTSMDALGMGGSNLNAYTGPVKNPYDKSCISGGSSGGSAALVGAKAVRLALGTDTGDSVRKPASYCGIVGVKPTYGRISRYGVVPYAASLDHVGYFTNNVKDAAVALEVLAGRDNFDMTSSNREVEAYSNLLELDLKGKRVGIFKNVMTAITHEDTKELMNSFISKLEEQGCVIVEKEMDSTLARALYPTYTVIANAEATTLHASLDGIRFGLSQEGKTLEEVMTHTRTEGFSSYVKERLVYGSYALDFENQELIYDQAKKVRRLIADNYNQLLEDVDIMIAPAAPHKAPKLDADLTPNYTDEFLIAENHMVVNNFTGNPSMTLPLGKVEGMPLGLNISTKAYEESKMFAFASEFEKLIGWEGDF